MKKIKGVLGIFLTLCTLAYSFIIAAFTLLSKTPGVNDSYIIIITESIVILGLTGILLYTLVYYARILKTGYDNDE